MTNKNTNSLRNICRTCLSTLSDTENPNDTTEKQCIYEVPIGSSEGTSIMELLQIVQPLIKVQIKDELPKLMCSDCIKKLQVTHEFLEMYKEVDKKFRKMLKEVDINDTKDYLNSYDETADLDVEKFDTDENVDHLDEDNDNETQEITSLEIETMNDRDFPKEQDEEIENVWPEFEEEQPIHEVTDENVEQLQCSINADSDDDDEWKPDNSRFVIISKLKVEYV